jgi:hypothetical protein
VPLYPLSCDNEECGDRQEALLLLREYEAGNLPACKTCGGPTHRIWVAHHSQCQHFDPIVFHESSDGRLRFPGRTDGKVPQGFERKEIRTFREYEAFRRKVDHIEANKIEIANEAEHVFLHMQEAANRPDLRQAMQHMTPQWKAFCQRAIENGNARPRTFAPNFFVEAMEFDSSNREAWDDGDRRGRAKK